MTMICLPDFKHDILFIYYVLFQTDVNSSFGFLDTIFYNTITQTNSVWLHKAVPWFTAGPIKIKSV